MNCQIPFAVYRSRGAPFICRPHYDRRCGFMLDKLGISGEYRDKDISVDIMLENPLEYGIDAGILLLLRSNYIQ